MKKLQKLLYWMAFLWKRLYKKATFLLLLISIPLLVLGYNATAQEDSGVLTIALASRPTEVEALTRSVWDELQESQLILYVECESPEAATEMVRRGDADTAWIFEENLEHKIYDFVARRSRQNAFVTVIEPEDRAMLKLLREARSGTMFPHCSQALYLTYLRENAPELQSVSDEQLLTYYENAGFDENLFLMTDIEGNSSQPEENTNYLLTPIRGMLAVVGIVHTGIAYALYFGGIRDVNAQTAAILSYLDPVLSILLSALILREAMDVFAVIGAVLILGSALYCELPERKMRGYPPNQAAKTACFLLFSPIKIFFKKGLTKSPRRVIIHKLSAKCCYSSAGRAHPW